MLQTKYSLSIVIQIFFSNRNMYRPLLKLEHWQGKIYSYNLPCLNVLLSIPLQCCKHFPSENLHFNQKHWCSEMYARLLHVGNKTRHIKWKHVTSKMLIFNCNMWINFDQLNVTNMLTTIIAYTRYISPGGLYICSISGHFIPERMRFRFER